MFATLFGTQASGQEIRIKVIDGRSGHPATKECLNVSLGVWHGADIVPETDKDGMAVLHLINNEFVAERACPGWPSRATRGTNAETIVVVSGSSVTCQEYGKAVPGEPVDPNLPKRIMPSYSIKEILESGLVTANTCGKIRAEATPGELIMFVRPLTWLEKLKL